MFHYLLNLFKREKVLKTNTFFDIIEKEIDGDVFSGKKVKVKRVRVKNSLLKNSLTRFFPNNEKLYDLKPELPIDMLIPKINKFKDQNAVFRKNVYNKNKGKTALEELVEFLDVEFVEYFEKLKRVLEDGKISFKYLWYIFKQDEKFIAKDKGETVVGSIVQDSDYSYSWFSTKFIVNGTVIDTNGKEFISHVKAFTIESFSGVIQIKDLPLFPVAADDPIIKSLTERGKCFSEVAIGSHYRSYSGNLRIESTFYANLFFAPGRCMVDSGSFIKNNPNYSGMFKEHAQKYHNFNTYGVNQKRYTIKKFKKLSPQQYFICPSYVLGFSFRLKKWGELKLDKISDIKFNDEAFQSLVLDKRKKSLIKSFVINNQKAVSDIIQNKGGGAILLLHGPPGTGKTLTAESIAELLHRPLYSCSIGELGTDPVQLEKSLSNILDICKIWNAVILIDEADIFLETRSRNDILRNAMVGIFLRLLEYHDGVLFLTTNRVKCFDKAFQSRISIAFRYKELNADSRKLVWENLLKFFKFDYDNLDLDELKKHELNGREIRTVIKLASTLSNKLSRKKDCKYEIQQADIEECIECVNAFDELNDDD